MGDAPFDLLGRTQSQTPHSQRPEAFKNTIFPTPPKGRQTSSATVPAATMRIAGATKAHIVRRTRPRQHRVNARAHSPCRPALAWAGRSLENPRKLRKCFGIDTLGCWSGQAIRSGAGAQSVFGANGPAGSEGARRRRAGHTTKKYTRARPRRGPRTNECPSGTSTRTNRYPSRMVHRFQSFCPTCSRAAPERRASAFAAVERRLNTTRADARAEHRSRVIYDVRAAGT